MRPDGSDPHILLPVDSAIDEPVGGMTADPSGTFLLYNVGTTYSLVQNGRAKVVGALGSRPRWSPDGKRFVASTPSETRPPVLFMYDMAAGSGRELAVAGMAPDWFPDGQQLVYVQNGNVWSYDLRTNKASQLTMLPTVQQQAWAVQDPHVLPDGQHVVFYGGRGQELGASGNGQRWWILPAGGGDVRQLTEPNGNGVSDWSIGQNSSVFGYGERAHSSACESVYWLGSVGTEGDPSDHLLVPLDQLGLQPGSTLELRGWSWSPVGDALVFAIAPYECGVNGRTYRGPPLMYTWQITGGKGQRQGVGAPHKLAEGAYPVWTR
ncbi:MAG: hypothetical protein NVS2B7_38810 [Herpetosiphon sp.]